MELNMEYTALVELIGTTGFPIAMVIALLWFVFTIYKKSEQREDALRQQIIDAQLTNKEAIKTLALYAERLGVVEQDVKEIKEILISQD